MTSDNAERIPVSIVTGFLGSGKTTLISALLRQPSMAGTAVIVNEFGEVGIDDAVFADAIGGDSVALLANGCLCCTAGNDLARTVWGLVRRDPAPNRIVVETTGLADPLPILHRLMGDPRLRLSTRLDAVVTTVDAPHGLDMLLRQPVAERQAAVADRCVITKGDIASASTVEAIRGRLAALNPGASVQVANFGAIDADAVFGASLHDQRGGEPHLSRWLRLQEIQGQPLHRSPRHRAIRFSGESAGARTWLVEETRPICWRTLAPRLVDIIARHGDTLFRVKGVIRTIEDPRPLVIHGVQRMFHPPARLARWRMAPTTAVVAIGDGSASDAVTEIAEALAEAVATEPVQTAVTATWCDSPTPKPLSSQQKFSTDGSKDRSR